MNGVKWPCIISDEGILGVQFYYWGSNKRCFTKPSKIYNVDRRLFIALAATILDGKEKYNLSAINHMGIYCNRSVRGTNTPSTHAFGLGIDVSGLRVANGVYWVDIDNHKKTLEKYAHKIFFKYFEDVITWDQGQYRGSEPFSFSYKTRNLHKDHYHLNPSRWSRFHVKTDIYHNASILRILNYLGYEQNIRLYQKEKSLKSDGIAGKHTTLALVKDLGGECT